VTFNYDRSLQFYLLRAFQNALALDHAEAVKVLKRIEFVHVYGAVGALPVGSAPGIPFGHTNSCFMASQSIGLVTPRTLEPSQARAQELLGAARRIIFLGFGFWKENLDVLCPGPTTNNPIWDGKHVFASCYKLWRSTQNQSNGRFKFRGSPPQDVRPLINWGTVDQDIFAFVTHWNLKGS
jgi:hypothetical protein